MPFKEIINLTPREHYIHKVTRLLLLVGSMVAGIATVIHFFEPNTHPLNLIVPPMVMLAFLGAALLLHSKPHLLKEILWGGLSFVILCFQLPIWVFISEALNDENKRLVDTLPPITPLLVPIIMTLFLFLRPNQVLKVSLVAWLMVGLPLIGYLVLHPEEFWSPRGLEMFIALGPVMALVMVLIPYHRGLDKQFASMAIEKEKLQNLAERDGLSGLYNRRAGEKFLLKMLERSSPSCGLILLDIDKFKAINDTFGHNSGDLVIKEIAKRCQERLRHGDIIARWGGEEFVVLLRGGGEEACFHTAETLRNIIVDTEIEAVGNVSASFGITQFRRLDTMTSILHRADTALYQAKEQGRNRVVIG